LLSPIADGANGDSPDLVLGRVGGDAKTRGRVGAPAAEYLLERSSGWERHRQTWQLGQRPHLGHDVGVSEHLVDLTQKLRLGIAVTLQDAAQCPERDVGLELVVSAAEPGVQHPPKIVEAAVSNQGRGQCGRVGRAILDERDGDADPEHPERCEQLRPVVVRDGQRGCGESTW
jgi:hypothetical protein